MNRIADTSSEASMSAASTTSHVSVARQPNRTLRGVVLLSMIAVSCAGSEASTVENTTVTTSVPTTSGPATIAATTSPTTALTTSPTTVPATSATTHPTTNPTTVPVTRSNPPITLGEEDRFFHAGVDTVVVAHAPAPWEPFPVSRLGMRRDLGTAEWVGISFWEPWEVPVDSCRWRDSWVDAGDSVAELAEALTSVPGRNATPPEPVTVGGYSGLYLEWSLPVDLDISACDDETTVAWTGADKKTRSHSTPGVIDRIWILDVEGRRIVIDVLSLPVEQDVIRERVDAVIASLRFAPRT